MAKRKRASTKEQIERWIKEGRGSGEGKDYKPWLTIRDVPSKGIVSRSKGWKTERIHHLMSNLELHYFYTLEWSDEVMDIREQYPLLPLERTTEIAENLGVKHPMDPITKEPVVMTTDFLVAIKTPDGLELRARTIKQSSDLKNRTIEKFAIEQQFYAEQAIDWGIVTDIDKSRAFIRNIEFLYNAKYIDNIPGLDENNLTQIASPLFEEISNREDSLSSVALECDGKLGLHSGTCLFVVKHMLANKYWITDLHDEIDPLNKVNILR